MLSNEPKSMFKSRSSLVVLNLVLTFRNEVETLQNVRHDLDPNCLTPHRFRINTKFEHKIVNIFLPISLSIYFVLSKEPSH